MTRVKPGGVLCLASSGSESRRESLRSTVRVDGIPSLRKHVLGRLWLSLAYIVTPLAQGFDDLW